ncbi:MAG: SDR family oxidoreductase [Proteobacteria bacterium]|nr:SDR family oxidoreductase [Pseudomonadota bacterium]
MTKTAIIVSISSDIGTALAQRWLARGWAVFGTYRTRSAATDQLAVAGAKLVVCDTSNQESLDASCVELNHLCTAWDILVIAPGTTEPIGLFAETDFDEWARSIEVNFTSQMRLTHRLLSSRRTQAAIDPCVIFFAGGGTNNATTNYSAYTVSKIGLIKMCELLDAEIPDVRFTILGPGWVDTKIHKETLGAGARAGANLVRTRQKIEDGDFTRMEDVLDCCDWLVASPREEIGGRNFSVAHDAWGSRGLSEALLSDPDMYKLRRSGNNLKSSISSSSV